MYNDVPICLNCIDLYVSELTGECLADWCRRRVVEQIAKTEITT